jgi:hypothetical protein
MSRRGKHIGYWWKSPPGRPRGSRADNIKVDLWQISWGGVDWIDLAQERDQLRVLVNRVMNLQVP